MRFKARVNRPRTIARSTAANRMLLIPPTLIGKSKRLFVGAPESFERSDDLTDISGSETVALGISGCWKGCGTPSIREAHTLGKNRPEPRSYRGTLIRRSVRPGQTVRLLFLHLPQLTPACVLFSLGGIGIFFTFEPKSEPID
jgi:hypothetical protein